MYNARYKDKEFAEQLEEKLDELFPKNACKERGPALVLNAWANLLHSQSLEKYVENKNNKSGESK